jgi:predicted DNA-binding transcriptional regulator AlpA
MYRPPDSNKQRKWKMSKTTLQCIMEAVSRAQDISQHHKLEILEACNQKETVQNPPGFITTKMVSSLLGVSPRTIRNYVKRGTLTPKYLSKRKVFFRLEEIKQLIYKGIDAGRCVDDIAPEADPALPEDTDIEEHPAMDSCKQVRADVSNIPPTTGPTVDEHLRDFARKEGLTLPE